MLEVVFQGSKCRIETVLLRFSWSYSHSTGFFIPFRGSGSGAKSVPLFGGDTAELNIASVRILSSWTPKRSFMIGQSYKWPFYPLRLVLKESTQIDSKENKTLEQESFLPKHSWNALKCYFPFQPFLESFAGRSPVWSCLSGPAKGIPPWRYPQFSGGEEWPSSHRGRCFRAQAISWRVGGAISWESLVVTFSKDGEVDLHHGEVKRQNS